MATNSKIEWTHHTFNPWRGCTKVAEGCKFCYADALSKRNPNTLGVWGPDGTRVMAAESYWREPFKWNQQAEFEGERRRVFCASLADVFEDWGGQVSRGGLPVINGDIGRDTPMTLASLRARLFALIDSTPHLDWLLLTKRPENIRRMWPKWDNGEVNTNYRRNVWLLTSIATQADADKNVPELLKCRDLAPVLGLSCEPLVGPVDLMPHIGFLPIPHDVKKYMERMTGVPTIDWVIVGGESGGHARPMHPDWARSIRDQCQAAGVPFFFKQWGEWGRSDDHPLKKVGDRQRCRVVRSAGGDRVFNPNGTFTGESITEGDEWMALVGKKAAGRLLDGREWNEYPSVKLEA